MLGDDEDRSIRYLDSKATEPLPQDSADRNTGEQWELRRDSLQNRRQLLGGAGHRVTPRVPA